MNGFTGKTIKITDTETSGLLKNRDRINQFAGVDVDDNWEIIPGSELEFVVKQNLDIVPGPGAYNVTRISSKLLEEKGVTEMEASKLIYNYFTTSQKNTGNILSGYNTVSFDDEMYRRLFFRTMRSPYEHEWKDFTINNNYGEENNMRFDIFKAVMVVAALRPEILNWPTDDNGMLSTKLDRLSLANGIEHENQHDAMGDVYATVGIGKIIHDKNPKLMEYLIKLSKKGFVQDMATSAMNNNRKLVYIDTTNGKDKMYGTVVYPLINDKSRPGNIICLNLRHDPRDAMEMDLEDLQYQLFTKWEEKEGRPIDVPLMSIASNKLPMLFEEAHFMNEETYERFMLDPNQVNDNLAYVREDEGRFQRFREMASVAFSPDPKVGYPNADDTYDSIYSGIHTNKRDAFFARNDSSFQAKMRESIMNDEGDMQPRLVTCDVYDECSRTIDKLRNFDLILRSKWMNYGDAIEVSAESPPNILLEFNAITDYLEGIYFGDDSYRNLDDFWKQMDEVKMNNVQDETQTAVLEELGEHVKSQEDKVNAMIDLRAELLPNIEAAKEVMAKPYAIIEKARQANQDIKLEKELRAQGIEPKVKKDNSPQP